MKDFGRCGTGRLTRRAPRDGENGFALSSVLLVLLLLLTFAGASTLQTTLDLKSTAHFDTGNSAFFAAESGVLHALSAMNSNGVTRFQTDVVNRWTTVFGTSTKTMPSDSRISYQASVAADATNPDDKGTITVTGFAPLQAQRSIVVAVSRDGFVGSPGAIYLASNAVNAQFTGNSFEVSGNDHTMNGASNPSGPVKPGISSRTDAVKNAVVNSLNNNQQNNVQGLGFSLNPLTPSVMNTGGPDNVDLDNLIANILSSPDVVTTGTSTFNGNETFGTVAQPRIIHMTDNNVRLNGNATGAGILIADGSITINGDLNYVGWIIVRGETTINVTQTDSTTVLGNATIMGSLWTGDFNIRVGGSAIVDYCDECLQLIDDIGGVTGTMPRPMAVTSWKEIL